MEGTIKSIREDKWQDIKYFKIYIEENDKEYACWKGGEAIKVGQTVGFTEEEKNGRWKMILPGSKMGVGGGNRRSPEELRNQIKSFSMSYAKDIVCNRMSTYKDDTEVAAMLFKYANSILEWFGSTK